jgi:hypothetical protein
VSTTTAVASVTATLVRVINAAIANVPGATAAVGRPDGTVTNRPPGVNIFLFQITPNAALRNDDLPLRRSDGTLSAYPQAAIDLHYLFTFYGDETTYEPERLLGCVISALHARPALARQDLTTTETTAPFTTFSPLADLAGQSELVHFTQTVMNVEEISKLWSVFLQTPYVLSIVYQASVVLLETSDTPSEALPVLTPNLYAIPFVNPVISQVATPDGSPIVAGSTLLASGSNLQGSTVAVSIDGAQYAPATTNATQITLPLPAGIAAGVHGLQAVFPMQMGTPPTAHSGFASNVAAFVVQPTATLASVSASAASVNVTPTVLAGQRASLLLNATAGSPPPAYNLDGGVVAADATTLSFNVASVAAGTYLMRLQIDGAESSLSVDSTGAFAGPTVTVP